jgi:hypothetical protein
MPQNRGEDAPEERGSSGSGPKKIKKGEVVKFNRF